MSSRTVSVVLTAQVSNYLSNMRAAEERTRDVERAARTATQQFRAHQEAMHAVGIGMVAFGGLAAAGIAVAVKASAEFGAKMAQLQSLSHASAGSMRQMSDAAMSVGTAYGFTATQVADAEIELQKAGVGVAAQLGGALKGALSLAAAGQLDVAQATEITTVAMTQFGLSAKDVPHLADLLAAGADKALGSVGDLGEALKNGGLQAHNMGLTLDDTVGLLSAFANAGILGAEAGTQMRSMFLKLQNPTKASRDMLKEHNIALNDAGGHFVGVAKLGDELRANLGKLTDAERNHALAVIFGSHAITGATVLYQDSGKAAEAAGLSIADWTKAVKEGGFANAQAAGKMNSLTGDVQKLAAAFQNDLIKAGNAADGPMRGLAQTATGVVTALGGIPPVGQTAIMVVGGLTAAVGLLGGGALLLIPKITLARQTLTELGVSGREAGKLIGVGSGLMLGLAAATSGFAAMNEHATASSQQISLAGTRIAHGWSGLDKVFGTAGTAINAGKGLKASLQELGNGTDGTGDADMAKMFDGLTFGISHLSDVFKANEANLDAMGQQLGALAQTNYSSAASSFSLLTRQYHLGSGETRTLLREMGPYRDALIKVAEHNHIAATDTNLYNLALGRGAVGAKAIATATREAAAAAAKQATGIAHLAGEATTATTNLSALEKAIEGFGSSTLNARAAQSAMRQAIADATKTIGNNKKGIDLSTDAGRKNDAALRNIASSTFDAAAKTLHLTHSTKQAADQMQIGRDGFIKAAAAAGITGDKAQRLADKYGLIPKNVETAVHLTGYEDALVKAQALREELAKLHNKSITITVDKKGNVGAAYSDARDTAAGGKAAGGAIDGPGQKGVDSVPAVLAPGEHVLTAGDVDRLGGQGGAYRFRAALAAGDVQAFAKGGAVHKRKRHPAAHHVAAAHPHHSTRITDHSRVGAAHPHATRSHPKAKRRKGPTAAQIVTAAVQWGGRAYVKNGKIVRENDIARQDRLVREDKRDVTSDTARISRAKRTLRTRETAESRAQKAYDKIGSGKKDRPAKRRAKATLDAAKKRTAAAEKSVKSAETARDKDKTKRDTAAASAKQLRLDREDFVSAERRTPNRRVNDPLAYVDQLRTMSRDTDFSAGRRKKFDEAANQYEKTLVTLTTNSAKAAEKLTKLKDASDQLRDSISSAISGGFKASDAGSKETTSGWVTRNGMRFRSTSTGTSAGSLASYYSGAAATTKRFADDLAKLTKRGYPDALVAEVAGYGAATGQPIVTALLAATRAQQTSITNGYNAIGRNALAAGTTVAGDSYGAQIAAAKKDADQITAQIKDDGEKLRKLIATAYGLKGYATGTASAAAGVRWVGEDGPELIGFRGGERVLNAADSQRWIRGSASGGSPAPQPVTLSVPAFPDTITVQDASGFRATMRVVAHDVVTERTDQIAVRVLGATA